MDEYIGGIKIEIGGDINGLRKLVSEGKLSIEDLGKFLEQRLDKSSTTAERSVARLQKELTGVRPTAQLQQLAVALEKIGGTSKLTEIQVGNLQKKIEGLRQAGGAVPASLQSLTKSLEGLGAAGDKLKASGIQSLEGLTSKLGPIGPALAAIGPAGLAAAAGIAAMGGAIIGVSKLVVDAANWGDRITDAATAMGTTTTGVQRLEAAATAAGIPIERVTSSVIKMQKAMEESPEKFERLGLSMQQLKALAPEEQFRLVAERLNLIVDPAERNALAVKLLGKAWAELAPLVRGGFDAMDEAPRFTEEQVKALDELKTAMLELGREWELFWVSIGSSVASGGNAADIIRAVADGVRGLGNVLDSLPMDKLVLLGRILAGSMTAGASEVLIRGAQALARSGAASRAASAPPVDRRAQQIQEMEEEQRRQETEAADAAAAADKKRQLAERAAARAEAESKRRIKELMAAAVARGSQGLQWEDLDFTRLPGLMDAPEQLSISPHAGAFGELASGDFGRTIPDTLEQIHELTVLNMGSVQDWQGALQSVAATFELLGIEGGDAIGQLSAAIGSAGQLAAGLASGNVAGIASGGLGTLTSMFQMGEKGGALGTAASIFSPVAALGAITGGNRSRGTSALLGAATGGFVGAGIGALFGGKDEGQGKGPNTGFDSMDALITRIKEGQTAAADLGAEFDAAFSEMIPNAIDKTTGLLTANARAMIDVARNSGIASEAIKGLMLSQAQALGGNLASGLAGMTAARDKGVGGLASQGAATAIGASIQGSFTEMVKGGMSSREAIEALAPAIQSFRAELNAAGLEGGAAFGALEHQFTIMTGEITGPLVEGVTGFAGALANMANLGMLNQQTFSGMTEQIGANIAALAEQGVTGPAAIGALQPSLQTIWELQQKYGFEVDASTQALLDQAVEAHQVGEEHRSASDQMIEGIRDVVDAIHDLTTALAGIPKDKKTTVTVERRYTTSGDPGSDEGPAPGTEDPLSFAGGSDGIQNFGRGTPAILHNLEGVYTAQQIDALTNSARAYGAATMPATFGGNDMGALLERFDRMSRIMEAQTARINEAFRDAVQLLPRR